MSAEGKGPDRDTSSPKPLREFLAAYLEQANEQSQQFNALSERTERLEKRSLAVNRILAVIAVLALLSPFLLWLITERSTSIRNTIDLSQRLGEAELAEALIIQYDIRTRELSRDEARRAILTLEPLRQQLENLAACISTNTCNRELGLAVFCSRATQLYNTFEIAYPRGGFDGDPDYSEHFVDVRTECP
jgi:hypothetical protein